MLTVRELPQSEWHKLDGTGIGAVRQLLPQTATVIVVERGENVVACWAGLPTCHYVVEGLEVVPAEQGNVAVLRKLLLGMKAHLRAEGVTNVLTGANTDEIRALLAHAGAVETGVSLYAWPIEEGA